MLRCPAPVDRVYIGDRLRKRPRVSSEILRVVLSLAVGMSQRFLGNPRSASFGTFIVGIGSSMRTVQSVLCPVEHSIRWDAIPSRLLSVANVQLYAMVADAQTHAEPKCIAQPCCSMIYVRICQDGDDRGVRYGSVREHACSSLPLWKAGPVVGLGATRS